jgi:hypothetical protein
MRWWGKERDQPEQQQNKNEQLSIAELYEQITERTAKIISLRRQAFIAAGCNDEVKVVECAKLIKELKMQRKHLREQLQQTQKVV